MTMMRNILRNMRSKYFLFCLLLGWALLYDKSHTKKMCQDMCQKSHHICFLFACFLKADFFVVAYADESMILLIVY